MSNAIVHPTNRVWPDGTVIPTPEEGYDEGFDRGINWPDRWESHLPGGPWRSNGRHVALNASNEAYCDAWKRGWHAGHETKLALQRGSILFPTW